MHSIRKESDFSAITTKQTFFGIQIDSYKVSMVAEQAFLLLALGDMSLRLGFSLCSMGFFATPTVWMFSGGIVGLAVIFWAGEYYIREVKQQKNYLDKEELDRMKEEAVNLNFEQLIEQHTPEDLVHYIFEDNLAALQQKFKDRIQTTDNFESFEQNYNLKKLVDLGIVASDFYDWLQELQKKFDAQAVNCFRKLAKLETCYPLRSGGIEKGVGTLNDFFFPDPYKVIRSGVQYFMSSSDEKKLQEWKFTQSEKRLKSDLDAASRSIQSEYLEGRARFTNKSI